MCNLEVSRSKLVARSLSWLSQRTTFDLTAPLLFGAEIPRLVAFGAEIPRLVAFCASNLHLKKNCVFAKIVGIYYSNSFLTIVVTGSSIQILSSLLDED
jgi:hypothetical protein